MDSMDTKLRNYIRKHLVELVKITDCNTILLAHLESKRVLEREDVQDVEAERTQIAKSRMLYKIIETRSNSSYDILIESLKESSQSGAVAILQGGYAANLEDTSDPTPGTSSSFYLTGSQRGASDFTSLSRSPNILFGLQGQRPTPLFVGREKELGDLHKLLDGTNHLAVITHIASISGLGGIGKTQLARMYAVVYRGCYENNVIWIDAESEETLTFSFTNLATNKLNISTKNANGNEKNSCIIVQECYDFFKNQKCLFILDNVEKQKYLQTFLPLKDTSKNVFVLMTSRYQDWGKHVTKLELNIFSEEEATSFVKKGLEILEGTYTHDIKLLVRRLQYFPLAISQAISHISNHQKMGVYSISKYHEEFEVNSDHYLDCDLSDEFESDYTKTTFTSWKMTIDKIAQVPKYGQLAVKILHLVDYFSPDDIHRDTFLKLDCPKDKVVKKTTKLHKKLLNTVANLVRTNTQQESVSVMEKYTDENVKEAVSLLISYSMVSGKENQSIISIHRLVQEVVRIELRRSGKEEEILDMALKLSEKCLCEKFVPHAIFLWKYIEEMPELVCKFVNLATGVIYTLADVGRYNEACQFGLYKLEKLKNARQVNKRSILEFEFSVGQVLRLAGNYEASLHHLNCVQEECRNIEDDDYLFSVEQQIACVFDRQGRYSEAFDLRLKMCESSKVIFGEQSLQTARSLFMTADNARSMGKYDLSYLTYQEGFHCYDKATEKDELTFLHARLSFARIVGDRGNTNEAITILEEINAKIIENPGLKVPFSLRTSTLSTLGAYLNNTNKHVDAHKILEELYKEQESVLGEDHEETLITLIHLGVSLSHMKQYEEAYLACNTAYSKLKEKLGSESESTLEAQRWCALVLSNQGQHSTAISLITIVVKTLEKTMPLTSSNVLNSKYSYAQILERANRCKEAVVVLEELKATYLQIFGVEHPDYLECVKYIEKIKLGGSELRDWLS